MLMGHIDGLPKLGSSKDLLLANPVSEIDGDSDSDTQEQIVYMASFEELASKNVQYDTIIWVSISLLLVLAWGVGIIMLLYLPVKRYVLRKDISSRKLYVTQNEIVYKVLRPCFIPFFGVKKIVRRVPLSQVIDIIIEQAANMDPYCILTYRTQEKKSSVASGKGSNPDWNETFLFTISDNTPDLRIKIMDSDHLTQDDFVGEATIPLEVVFDEGDVAPMAYNVVKNEKYCGEIRVGLAFTREKGYARGLPEEDFGGWRESN